MLGYVVVLETKARESKDMIRKVIHITMSQGANCAGSNDSESTNAK
jgi:hypothetical protein